MAFERVSRQLCLTEDIATRTINKGYCFEWARRANQLCPASEIFYIRRLIPHAFIRYCGRWYDAQLPKGAHHWQQLPLLKPCQNILRNHDLIQWHPGDHFWRLRTG